MQQIVRVEWIEDIYKCMEVDERFDIVITDAQNRYDRSHILVRF